MAGEGFVECYVVSRNGCKHYILAGHFLMEGPVYIFHLDRMFMLGFSSVWAILKLFNDFPLLLVLILVAVFPMIVNMQLNFLIKLLWSSLHI